MIQQSSPENGAIHVFVTLNTSPVMYRLINCTLNKGSLQSKENECLVDGAILILRG